MTCSCLIDRYREHLPFAPEDPVVSLCEGRTPLLPAPVISEMVGAEVHLKLEGGNPTGSFKDRGMTCAVSAAVREGSKAVICASTGNTAASAAAYAAKAGLTCAVIVPDGKIAIGKLAQTLIHGARVIAVEGNFDRGLELVRELVEKHPITLVNSVNEFRIEGQKTAAFELLESLDGGPDLLCIPVGNAGNVTSYWRGFTEMGASPRLFGFQAEGAAPLVLGHPVEHPETVASAIRIGNPVPLGGRDGGDDGLARRDPLGRRWRDPRCLPAARGQGRALLRARLGGVGRGSAQVRRRRRQPRGLCDDGSRPEGPADRDRERQWPRDPVRRGNDCSGRGGPG